MKGLSTLVMFQALVATISGTMMANMSTIGRIGIFFFYQEYSTLKVWWKTAIILFGIQLTLIFILWLIKKLVYHPAGLILPTLTLAVGMYGAYLTYIDFTTTSHRYLKSEFHIGGYLFWGAWMISCLYFLVVRPKRNTKTDTSAPAEEIIQVEE